MNARIDGKAARPIGRGSANRSEETAATAAIEHFVLTNAPGHLLRRNHQRSYEIFSQHVGDDVTRQQMSVLIVLAQSAGASQNDLVAKTAIDKSTMKEMLGRMIARGWVRRERHPHDSRAWAMSITQDGIAMLDQRLPLVVAAQAEILAPLSPALQPVFLRCLRIMAGLEQGEPSGDVNGSA